jgi:plastocyanin
MRRVTILTAAAFALAGGVAQAAPHDHSSPAPGASVQILASAFGSPQVDTLAGDTVTWSNASVRPHTVTDAAGAWTSERMVAGQTFSHTFDAPGVQSYFCRLHPSMRGQVTVHRLLLDAPTGTAAPGLPFTLTGRAAFEAGTPVEIRDGAGSPVAQAAVGSDGRFAAQVRPTASGAYTAAAAGESSPAVQLLVVDRHVHASSRRPGRARVHVAPASKGQVVVLQLRLRERFGWWPVARARLDARSRAVFTVRRSRAVRARVVLVGPDGATPLARSAALTIRPRGA